MQVQNKSSLYEYRTISNNIAFHFFGINQIKLELDKFKVHPCFSVAQARLVDEKAEGLKNHAAILSDPDVEHMKEMVKTSAEEALIKLSKKTA